MFDYPLNGDDSYAELYSLGYKLITSWGLAVVVLAVFVVLPILLG